MTTAPSEIRKATGILPPAGGFRGCALPIALLSAVPARAEASASRNAGNVLTRLHAAAVLSKSLLFMAEVYQTKIKMAADGTFFSRSLTRGLFKSHKHRLGFQMD